MDQAKRISEQTVMCERRANATPLARGLLLIGAGLRELASGSHCEHQEGLAIACGAVARRCAQDLSEAA